MITTPAEWWWSSTLPEGFNFPRAQNFATRGKHHLKRYEIINQWCPGLRRFISFHPEVVIMMRLACVEVLLVCSACVSVNGFQIQPPPSAPFPFKTDIFLLPLLHFFPHLDLWSLIEVRWFDRGGPYHCLSLWERDVIETALLHTPSLAISRWLDQWSDFSGETKPSLRSMDGLFVPV